MADSLLADGALGVKTRIVTVAVFEVKSKLSATVYVNWSVPVNPVLGVYVTCPVVVLTDADPSLGPVTTVTEEGPIIPPELGSLSLAKTSIAADVSSGVTALTLFATGGL